MHRWFRMTFGLAVIVAAHVTSASAQTSSSPQPQHKHYDRPEPLSDTPAPDGSLAPRLQNLGVHTFPVTTSVEPMQAGIAVCWASDAREPLGNKRGVFLSGASVRSRLVRL